WNIAEAFVTYKGNDYRFWAEHELIENQYTYEFMDGEPQGDFDFEKFEQDVHEMLDNYDNFCAEHNIEKVEI
ncbi:MAG: hypothetical protein V4440_04485, partial [Pseudomonadota bacterium]